MSDKEMEIGITFSLIIFLNHNYHKKKSSLIFLTTCRCASTIPKYNWTENFYWIWTNMTLLGNLVSEKLKKCFVTLSQETISKPMFIWKITL